jgi:hypothetical protein
MRQGALWGLIALGALGLGLATARAQEEGSTPGALPNPGTYQGSMELQRQEQQQSEQQGQQNQQMLQRLDQTYRQYAPRGGAGGARAGGGARAVDWWAKPPLPAARNPLLGRWRQVASQGVSARQIGGPLAEGAASLFNGAMAGGCESMFGKGVIAFEPSSLQWVAPDGHEEILNHVAYRASAEQVVVLSRDPGAIPALIFGFPGHDHAVVAFFNCTMDRLGARPPSASAPAPYAAPAGAAPGPAAPAAGAASAVLNLQVGEATPGAFAPFANIQFLVTPVDPVMALRNAGIVPPSGRISPPDQIFADCHQQDLCVRDWRALAVGGKGVLRTDAAGHAQTPQFAAGHYYVLGIARHGNRAFIWTQPVDVRPGANTVTLDQTNARTFP